jgi:hypothetical protein
MSGNKFKLKQDNNYEIKQLQNPFLCFSPPTPGSEVVLFILFAVIASPPRLLLPSVISLLEVSYHVRDISQAVNCSGSRGCEQSQLLSY